MGLLGGCIGGIRNVSVQFKGTRYVVSSVW